MNKRTHDIFELLLTRDDYVTLHELSLLLSLSVSAIRSGLNDVNAFLEEHGLGRLTRMTHRGIRLEQHQRLIIAELLDSQRPEDTLDLTDAKSRRLLLLFVFLCIRTRHTTESLGTIMQTSVRTVSNDISALRVALEHRGLSLTYSRHAGYHIHGNVFNLRSLFIRWFQHAFALTDPTSILSGLNCLYALVGTTSDVFTCANMEELARTVNGILAGYTEASVRRSIMLQIVTMASELPGTREYGLTASDHSYLATCPCYTLARVLRASSERILHITLNPEEDYYLGMLLQPQLLSERNSDDQSYPFELEVMSQKLILSVGREYGFDFRDDTELQSELVRHLGPMVQRAISGTQIENPLVADVITRYGTLERIVEDTLRELEPSIGTMLSRDECTFVTLYFASSIEKLSDIRAGRIRIIIVCNSGNAVSRLLKYKLINAFNVEVIGIVAEYELYDFIARNGGRSSADLIVSVVDVDLTRLERIPLARVSALFSDYDYQELSHYLERRMHLSSAAPEPNRRGLLNLLSPTRFRIVSDAGDMDGLIRMGGALLHRAGLCDSSYPEQMVSVAHIFGPLTTILIAPKVIMPHAGISRHVFETGFSFVRSEVPIIVNGKPVTCAISLCATDKVSHQYAIQQLGMLLSKNSFCDGLDRVNTYDQLAELVTNCLSTMKGSTR